MISRGLKDFLETNVITSGATLKIEPLLYNTKHTMECTVNLIQPVNYDKYCGPSQRPRRFCLEAICEGVPRREGL